MWAMAVVGPLLIGTQVGAAIAVSLGLSAWRVTIIVTAATAGWAVLAAVVTLAITG